MKQETFEKASVLNTNIIDLQSAIDKIGRNQKDCNGYPINISFCYEAEREIFKGAVLSILNSRLAKLQKEFNDLK